MSTETQTRTYELISKFCPLGQREIRPIDQIIDDLGYDSIKVIELMIELELEFGLPPISEADSAELETAGDIAALIETKLAELKP